MKTTLSIALLIHCTAALASDSTTPATDAPTPDTATTVQKLEGPIDRSSTRLLLPDDPLPEHSLLIDRGTDAQRHACDGRIAEIRGDYRIVELTDTCKIVRIRGNFNVVRVLATEQIDIIGDDNALTWHTVPGDDSGREKPLLTTRGARNLVAPGD